jgi:ribosome-associated translation inhibitor RaiA
MATRSQSPLDIHVRSGVGVSPAARDYARRKVAAVSRLTAQPVLFARIRLTQSSDPAVERPAQAWATLDVNGRLVRAHVAAGSMFEAVDELEARLQRQVDRLLPDWESRRGGTPVAEAGEWRHRSVPAVRPPFYPRPPEARQVVRQKSFTLTRITPEEAAEEMEILDHDFHLFVDAATGQDAVIYRDGTGYGLAQLHPKHGAGDESGLPLTRSSLPPPRLALEDARERLDLADGPFLFFQNEESRRANILYRRYDGHYGLITPARP